MKSNWIPSKENLENLADGFTLRGIDISVYRTLFDSRLTNLLIKQSCSKIRLRS